MTLRFPCHVLKLLSGVILAVLSPTIAASQPSPSVAETISKMSPGSWIRPGNNDFASVAYSRSEHDTLIADTGSPPFWGVVGSDSTIVAWQGAAFDSETGRMFFHGGGYSDYGGNEVYQFDFGTLLWSRLTEPAPYTGAPIPNDRGIDARYPVTGPLSVHTYDGLVWSHATQSFWLATRNTGFDIAGLPQPELRHIWEFSPRSRNWSAHTGYTGYSSPSSVYNSDTREIWIFGDSPTATIVTSDRRLLDVIVTGARNWLSLGAAAYDSASKSAIYARTAHGKKLLRVKRTGKGLDAVALTDIPVSAAEVLGGGAGIAIRNGVVWLWGGNNQFVTWNPVSNEWRLISPASGPSGRHVYGKFHYWSEFDVFVGMSGLDGPWIYRPGENDGVAIDLNADRAKIGDIRYQTVQQALMAARDGDTVTIFPGTYAEGGFIDANGVTIIAPNAHLKDTAVGGKATLVIRGNDTTIIGLEVSGVNVPSGNGAAIRLEGRGITLRDVYFHDSQEGLLGGGGIVTVENSRFERLGGDARSSIGQAHGIYVDIKTEALIIRNSRFLASKEEGHEIKSRAKRTEIYDTVVDSLDGVDSRLVDMPNAGILIIERSTLREGPNSANHELIGYGLEPQIGGLHKEQNITIRNSVVINASGTNRRFLRIGREASPSVSISGNTFVEIEPGL